MICQTAQFSVTLTTPVFRGGCSPLPTYVPDASELH